MSFTQLTFVFPKHCSFVEIKLWKMKRRNDFFLLLLFARIIAAIFTWEPNILNYLNILNCFGGNVRWIFESVECIWAFACVIFQHFIYYYNIYISPCKKWEKNHLKENRCSEMKRRYITWESVWRAYFQTYQAANINERLY